MDFPGWPGSLRQIAPEAVDDGVIERFIAELDSSTLVRNLRYRSGLVRRAWNALVAQHPTRLRPVTAKPNQRVARNDSVSTRLAKHVSCSMHLRKPWLT